MRDVYFLEVMHSSVNRGGSKSRKAGVTHLSANMLARWGEFIEVESNCRIAGQLLITSVPATPISNSWFSFRLPTLSFMPSSFTWLDYSEHERRKMLDVIDLFGEKTTRDELGLGGVRDAFADLLFPGTTTIQTVAKYFLFVPWMYMNLERKQVPSSKVAELVEVCRIDLSPPQLNIQSSK